MGLRLPDFCENFCQYLLGSNGELKPKHYNKLSWLQKRSITREEVSVSISFIQAMVVEYLLAKRP
jgi:hypothetical protein